MRRHFESSVTPRIFFFFFSCLVTLTVKEEVIATVKARSQLNSICASRKNGFVMQKYYKQLSRLIFIFEMRVPVETINDTICIQSGPAKKADW